MCAAPHRPALGALAALGLSACNLGVETGVFEPAYGIAETGRDTDDDGDGYTLGEGDCDDADAEVNPAATETAGDGVDSNCDGEDDV